jgi:integrase
MMATKQAGETEQDDSRAADRYAHTVKLFIAHLGDKAQRPINTVTSRHITSFLTARLKAKKSTKTVSVDMKTLSSAFNRARKEGIIATNPVEGVESPKVKSHTRDVFTSSQVAILTESAPSADWKTLIMLGFFTGARLRDCAEMKWGHVNWEANVIEHQQRKTGKTVVVPLHPDLEARLSELSANDKPETYLCPSLAGLYCGGKSGLSAGFKSIMAKAGIDTKTVKGMGERTFSKLSFHSLRHTYNSILANAHVSQEIRMKLTGHTTVANNANYTHHELKTLKSAIRKLPSLRAPTAKAKRGK